MGAPHLELLSSSWSDSYPAKFSHSPVVRPLSPQAALVLLDIYGYYNLASSPHQVLIF